jgi:hypothetical protein
MPWPPRLITVKDILRGVEKATGNLSEETAEEF